jgi:hypothetical protein
MRRSPDLLHQDVTAEEELRVEHGRASDVRIEPPPEQPPTPASAAGPHPGEDPDRNRCRCPDEPGGAVERRRVHDRVLAARAQPRAVGGDQSVGRRTLGEAIADRELGDEVFPDRLAGAAARDLAVGRPEKHDVDRRVVNHDATQLEVGALYALQPRTVLLVLSEVGKTYRGRDVLDAASTDQAPADLAICAAYVL